MSESGEKKLIEITTTQGSDSLYPNIYTLPADQIELGFWGRQRRSYLWNYQRELWDEMQAAGILS